MSLGDAKERLEALNALLGMFERAETPDDWANALDQQNGAAPKAIQLCNELYASNQKLWKLVDSIRRQIEYYNSMGEHEVSGAEILSDIYYDLPTPPQPTEVDND